MAVPAGNDPDSSCVTGMRASMNTLEPCFLATSVGNDPTLPVRQTGMRP